MRIDYHVHVTAPCPICKKAAQGRETNPHAPFCCERCKLVDLGNWLTDAYRIPDEETEPNDEREDGT